MGYSTEEDRCDSTGKTSTVVNEVDFSVGDGNPDMKTSTDDQVKLNDNIHSTLKVDESLQNRNEVSLTASVIRTEKCEWTRWSQWSACTASCGAGDKVRKRRCSCGELRCGTGPDQETSKCNEWKCDKKMPPTFKID
ncbi:thrombospondin type 1 domain protein [Ancylostoma caninum]|uniref:Thrombospondin type 1 domain protein n=1 Tax=Ancylostoma caninum TaxID=29170 RepID=A0A368GLF8_ANCCA|nr:thrombospondin type 1 domain protein [Ancylostoma caninum]